MSDDYHNYDPKAEQDYNNNTEENNINSDYQDQQSVNSGLAVASLILGISSLIMCTGPLTGIPGVICGHIARAKAARGKAGGAGMALGGLITGYLGSILVTLFIISYLLLVSAFMIPALSKAKARASEIKCQNNLRQIGMGLVTYASDNKRQFPPYDGAKGLDMLRSNGYLDDPTLFVCPSCNTAPAAYGQPITEATCDYNYKGGGRIGDSGWDNPIVWDKDNNHKNSGNAVFDDGHVETKKGMEWEKILNNPSSSEKKLK